LHGAFKGGWSAGYYNTVGSKEGKFEIKLFTKKNSKPYSFLNYLII
jgi:hypothetical protein